MTSDIDIGGVKPLVTRTEIHCGRPGNTRISAGKPTYKSQEEQYQEIQELRRSLGELREEHSGLKTRNRRLEEDLIRRDRQIEQLMDPAKNDEARRKLTDKGASLVSSLKLRVSRLEATLKDKEAELAKVQASAKATALNEMKIEAETYYQEVVRLRNQLNIAQHQQQTQQFQPYPKHQPQYSPHNSQHFSQGQQQLPPQLQASALQEPKGVNIDHWSNMRSGRDSRDGARGRRDGGDGQESPSTSLRHALVHLEEENTRLENQVSVLKQENSKLSTDMERVLGLSDDLKNNYEGMGRAELIREVERGQEEIVRLEAQHTQLTEAISRRNDIAGENTGILQARVSELQGREVEWERERASLRELISTLKEDRMFYKETAQKKDAELDSLRSEVQSLQQEVISLHDAQRRRIDHPPPLPGSQRFARGSTRPGPSTSRSGSSSDTNAATRRPRPSSARPPSAASRLQRPQKSSSEPREIPPPGSSRRMPPHQSARKGPPARSNSRPPSNASVSNMMSSGSNARPGSSSSRKVGSTSTTPKASPYGSPKHSSIGRGSSTSSSKTPTPSSSPRKTASSMSPQRRIPSSSSSPQRKPPSSSSSVGRIPTSRSSSRTPTGTPSSGSPNKSATPNRSPSKVPVGRASASPSASPLKKGKMREESASPARTPKSSRQGSAQNSSALVAVGSRRQVTASVNSRYNHVVSEQTLQSTSNKTSMQSIPPQSPRHRSRVDDSKIIVNKEEDERVLAEILFHRETDSSGEASDHPHLARQRTITLTSQDEATSGPEEAEPFIEQKSGSAPLKRQNTVTLSTQSDVEDPSVEKEISAEASSAEEEEAKVSVETEEKSESEALKSSLDDVTSVEHDEEIIENLELLQCLLSSHLNRQREVNELLSQEPLLVGEGQTLETRRNDRNTREAPDGEEYEKESSKQSQNMVRQGTFNVHEQETVATIHATLDAHLTRVNKVQQFNTD